jgi:hypothetical protein
MKKLSNIIMMTMVMTVLFSSCSKTNELDPCYVIEQEIERQESSIDRMMELYLNPNTDPDIWGQLNVRMMEARAKLGELEIERSEVCG